MQEWRISMKTKKLDLLPLKALKVNDSFGINIQDLSQKKSYLISGKHSMMK